MKPFIHSNGAIALFTLTMTMTSSSAAKAEPIRNPQNCSGPVTIGVATCPDKPGHWVECIPSGDYMCCTSECPRRKGLRAD